MDPVVATIVAVVIMVIGMVFLLLYVTRKAYSRKWENEQTFLDADEENEHTGSAS
ncbi:hypothetical protein [Paenibacillus apiarius]|uniref:Uncharacterized protein n=1 Tax=Paenibacillus apiarius TaxID=46240 RepID=A0ABT4DPH6_9BACL|nr:hypothetical protein [Paenibacillus apiarius]MCY9513627.1 hypothetical protein [Paenibacillus apiarius]MCY9518178.1 hypothetical protein [Paenibacillus apiarius]MCY9551421.1 hypothetical protein [Paenibacillus apiarius]MCY9558575.1 hypothetical protein [Paenibacillus apiarius]MCY9684111.1 hypothetical protein [Paenibacillus apiarius]